MLEFVRIDGCKTNNDSSKATTFSWEVTINPRELIPERIKLIEDVLHGNILTPARLPQPDDLVELLGT